MGEIRLTCPECGTGYRLPEGAIPEAGRHVECSSCGHVWHQPGAKVSSGAANRPAASTAPGEDRPKLSRPLPDAVLGILLEEAELARQQRGADQSDSSDAISDPPPAPAADWPATTITDAGSAGAAATLSLGAERAPAGPAPSRHINTIPQRPGEDAPRHREMEETVSRTTPSRATPTDPVAEPTPAPDHRAYARGLRWSVGIAAALLLLYLAAPRFADEGAAGARLMHYRLAVDDGRLWLQDQLFGPRAD